MKWYGDKAKRAIADGAHEGLPLAAEELLGEARRLAPIEEGNLEKDSVASTDGLSAAVTFGVGIASAYAVRQHEELTWAHDPGRQAKYLETPLNDASVQERLNEILGAELKSQLKD